MSAETGRPERPDREWSEGNPARARTWRRIGWIAGVAVFVALLAAQVTENLVVLAVAIALLALTFLSRRQGRMHSPAPSLVGDARFRARGFARVVVGPTAQAQSVTIVVDASSLQILGRGVTSSNAVLDFDQIARVRELRLTGSLPKVRDWLLLELPEDRLLSLRVVGDGNRELQAVLREHGVAVGEPISFSAFTPNYARAARSRLDPVPDETAPDELL
jgi:hypothetical protein